jgi:hypothetical protein
MSTTPDIPGIATEVSTIDEAILRFMPEISMLIGIIPGANVATPFMPLVTELLTVLDNAAKHVAAGNTGSAVEDVLAEIKNHLTPGAPNSPILSGAVTN